MRYIIGEEELKLLEAANVFTRVVRHRNGVPVTLKGAEEKGMQVLVELAAAGAAGAADSPTGYARDLPAPTSAPD